MAEKDNQQSSPLAAEFIRNFLQEEPIPGIVYENGLYQRFVPEITLAEVNALAREWAPDGNRVVVVNAPQKGGRVDPRRRSSSPRAIAAAEQQPLQPYVDTSTSNCRCSRRRPRRARSSRPRRDPSSTSPNGSCRTASGSSSSRRRSSRTKSCFAPSARAAPRSRATPDFVAAITAAQVVQAGGIGRFSAIELQKMLTGKVASASAIIGDTDEMLSAAARCKDLETMFQLIYLALHPATRRCDDFQRDHGAVQVRRLPTSARCPKCAFAEALQGALSVRITSARGRSRRSSSTR